jgi:hypothetical protein
MKLLSKELVSLEYRDQLQRDLARAVKPLSAYGIVAVSCRFERDPIHPLVREEQGWVAFFSTKADATVSEILEAVADRAAIEQDFHDIKEVHGSGQQQVRHYWANLAAYHLTLWLHTLVELWAWKRTPAELCDRSHSPWDNADRRPSHADRCKALRRSCIHTVIHGAGPSKCQPPKLRSLVHQLIRLIA